MNTLRKIAACIATWLIAAHPALALNDTIGVTAGSGKTANLISFASTRVISEAGICDATTENQCAAVSAGGALLVTGTGGTFPISGTLTGITNPVAVTLTSTTIASGTVTANAGTNLNTSLLALEAGGNLASVKAGTDRLISSATNIVAGTALATTSLIIGTRYLSTPPTFTNGQEGAFQIDANGRMLVSATLGANQSVNEAQINGVTPLMGNGASGTGSQRMNVSNDNTAIANWGQGATGAAVPTGAQYVGMSQGGNLTGLTGTSGNLNVQCANCSGSGVSTVDAATFTASTSLFAGSGGFFQTTATSNPLTTGQQGMFQVTANRALFSNLRNAAGAEVGVAAVPLQVSLANTATNGTAVKVDGSAVTQPVSLTSTTITGTVAANPGTIATWGLMSGTTPGTAPTNTGIVGGIYNSSAPTATNGQTLPLQQDVNGNLKVNGVGVTLGAAIGTATASPIACDAINTWPTATTNATWVLPNCGLDGTLITRPFAPKEMLARGNASGTGATTVVAASGNAALKTYVTDWECYTTGAVLSEVTFNDVVGTGTSTKILVPATSGNNKSLHSPLVTAANTALTFTPSAGTVVCSVQGYYGP